MSQTPVAHIDADALATVLLDGDLSKLSPAQRVAYYRQVCESLGLNHLTRPFEYLLLGEKGKEKLTLYPRRDATDQLRKQQKVSITLPSKEITGDVYVVLARATMPDGRTDEATGSVSIVKENGEWKTTQASGKRYFQGDGTWHPLRGEALANAIMKCETKAKRRVTLSIIGLGWSDESEIESIPNARAITVDPQTGEITARLRAATTPHESEPDARRDMERENPPPLDRAAIIAEHTRLVKKARDLGIPDRTLPIGANGKIATEDIEASNADLLDEIQRAEAGIEAANAEAEQMALASDAEARP